MTPTITSKLKFKELFKFEYLKAKNKTLTQEELQGKLIYGCSTELMDFIANTTHFEIYRVINDNGGALLIPSSGTFMAVSGDVKPQEIAEYMCNNNLFHYISNDYKNSVVGLLTIYKEHQSRQNTIQADITHHKQMLIQKFEELQRNKNFINKLIEKRHELLKYDLDSNMNIYMTFQDVVASDTEGDGEDIDLGTLRFKISLTGHNVDIVEGTHSFYTEYNSEAYHPHHLNDRVCLGSQEADVVEAISTLELDVLELLIKRFAFSYTSSDSAGAYWKVWAGLDMDDDEESGIYVESRDRYYSDDEVRWSEQDEQYYYFEDCYYSEIQYDYFHKDEVIELENGRGYVHESYGNCVEIDGSYYHIDDTITDIHEDYNIKENCEYSNALEQYIPKNEAISHEGDWYTENTLPEVEESLS